MHHFHHYTDPETDFPPPVCEMRDRVTVTFQFLGITRRRSGNWRAGNGVSFGGRPYLVVSPRYLTYRLQTRPGPHNVCSSHHISGVWGLLCQHLQEDSTLWSDVVQVWAFENQITREWGTVRPLRKDLRACQSPTLDIYELQIAKEIFLNRVSNRSDKHLFLAFYAYNWPYLQLVYEIGTDTNIRCSMLIFLKLAQNYFWTPVQDYGSDSYIYVTIGPVRFLSSWWQMRFWNTLYFSDHFVHPKAQSVRQKVVKSFFTELRT